MSDKVDEERALAVIALVEQLGKFLEERTGDDADGLKLRIAALNEYVAGFVITCFDTRDQMRMVAGIFHSYILSCIDAHGADGDPDPSSTLH